MSEKRPPLEEALSTAMRALGNQVAREMQRTPAQREQHGVQKWEPYRRRIERVTAFLLTELGDEQVSLDSLLILSQSYAKAVQLMVEDLEAKGLGKVRSEYCRVAMEEINRSALQVLDILGSERILS